MKSNNRWFIVLTVIIIGLVGCNIYLVVQNKNIHTNKVDNDVSEKPISNNDDKEEEKKEKYYDCSFTRCDTNHQQARQKQPMRYLGELHICIQCYPT